MEANKCLELHLLRREVLSARDRGRVVIEFADGAAVTDVVEARQMADQMMAMVNLPLLGPHWNSIDRERACDVLAAVLHWDLSSARSRATFALASELTEKILDEFPAGSFYLTNVRPSADLNQPPQRWASGSVKGPELDAGVAIISWDRIGLCWVQDQSY